MHNMLIMIFYFQLPYMLDLHLFLGRPVRIANSTSIDGWYYILLPNVILYADITDTECILSIYVIY